MDHSFLCTVHPDTGRRTRGKQKKKEEGVMGEGPYNLDERGLERRPERSWRRCMGHLRSLNLT